MRVGADRRHSVCLARACDAVVAHFGEVMGGAQDLVAAAGDPSTRTQRHWNPPPPPHPEVLVGLSTHSNPSAPKGCIRREGTSEEGPEAIRQAVGGGCRSGWGPLLSVTNARHLPSG